MTICMMLTMFMHSSLQKNGHERGCLSMVLWPFGSPNFFRNWRNFLGLRNGRTFARHILLPSTHAAYADEDELIRLTIV